MISQFSQWAAFHEIDRFSMIFLFSSIFSFDIKNVSHLKIWFYYFLKPLKTIQCQACEAEARAKNF